MAARAPRVKRALAEGEDSELLQPHGVASGPKHPSTRYGHIDQSAQPEAATEAVSMAGFRVVSVKEELVDMEEAGDKQHASDKATSTLELKTVLVKAEPMDAEDNVAFDRGGQAVGTKDTVGMQDAAGMQDVVATKWETVFVKQEPVDEDDVSRSTVPGESQADVVFTNNICIKVEVEYASEERAGSGEGAARGAGEGAAQGTKGKAGGARRPQPPPPPSECDICHRKVASLSKLKEHMRIHTGEKPFRCETCQKGFTQTSHLKKHVRIHTGEKPYTCEICKKEFTLLDSLKIHQRIHTGEKPYSCKRCEKKFGDLSTLKRHGRIHTNEKPYTCNVCQKGFAQLGSLKVHERTHTGEKPYECEVCHKKFSESGTLKRHERIHTGEKPYTCEVCDRAFTELGCLNKHRRTHYKALSLKACQETLSKDLSEEEILSDPAGVEYMAAAGDGDPGETHVDCEADITLEPSVQGSSSIPCSNT